MSWTCEKCGKGIMRGHNVSHAKNRTKRVFKPNVQVARVKLDGERQKMYLCARCVRRVRAEARARQERLLKSKMGGRKRKVSSEKKK